MAARIHAVHRLPRKGAREERLSAGPTQRLTADTKVALVCVGQRPHPSRVPQESLPGTCTVSHHAALPHSVPTLGVRGPCPTKYGHTLTCSVGSPASRFTSSGLGTM